jgi:hypothetical protein
MRGQSYINLHHKTHRKLLMAYDGKIIKEQALAENDFLNIAKQQNQCE